MTYRIAYGRETETIEDHTQMVLLDLPDDVVFLPTEELEWWIRLNWNSPEILSQKMVGFTDVIERLKLILDQETPTATKVILASLFDTFDNNDD